MEPAHKAHFYQLRLELAQKHLSLTEMIRFDCFPLNILWILSLLQWTSLALMRLITSE